MPSDQTNPLWERDDIQFPRLLAEISAVGLSEGTWDDLLESMDLKSDDLEELFDRAERRWDYLKKYEV